MQISSKGNFQPTTKTKSIAVQHLIGYTIWLSQSEISYFRIKKILKKKKIFLRMVGKMD